jgi:hypothetical protein
MQEDGGGIGGAKATELTGADAAAETDDRTTTKDDGDREGDITTTTRTRRPNGTTTGVGNGDEREPASSSADGGGDAHDGTGTTSTSNDAIRASSSTGSAHRYAEVRADGMDHPSSSAVVVVPYPNVVDGAPPSTNVQGRKRVDVGRVVLLVVLFVVVARLQGGAGRRPTTPSSLVV